MFKNYLRGLFVKRHLPILLLASGIFAIFQRWPEVGVHLAICLMVAYPLCFAPFGLLRWMAKFPLFTANAISVWSVFVGVVAFPIFFDGSSVFPGTFTFDLFGQILSLEKSELIGLIVVTAAIALDRTDGRVAQATESTRSQKSKELGVWLDPLADKLKMLSMFAYLCLKHNLLSGWGLAFLTLTETSGTLLRPPFLRELDPKNPGYLDFLRARLKSGKATWVGKVKFVVLFLVLMAVLPEHLYHITMPWYVHPNLFLWLSVLFSLLSIASRFRIHPDFDESFDKVTTEVFNHEDL